MRTLLQLAFPLLLGLLFVGLLRPRWFLGWLPPERRHRGTVLWLLGPPLVALNLWLSLDYVRGRLAAVRHQRAAIRYELVRTWNPRGAVGGLGAELVLLDPVTSLTRPALMQRIRNLAEDRSPVVLRVFADRAAWHRSRGTSDPTSMPGFVLLYTFDRSVRKDEPRHERWRWGPAAPPTHTTEVTP